MRLPLKERGKTDQIVARFFFDEFVTHDTNYSHSSAPFFHS